MNKKRDAACIEYVGYGYGCDGDTSADSFKKGWDACVKENEKILAICNEIAEKDGKDYLELSQKYNEIIKLAAISSMTFANTEESFNLTLIDKNHEAWTPAYDDVKNSIKREIELIKENEKLKNEINKLKIETYRWEDKVYYLSRKVEELEFLVLPVS